MADQRHRRLDPALFENGNVQRPAGLTRVFVDRKIYHAQTNVVSTDTLRAAPKEPEKHRDLLVKVAGYNAFFTQPGRAHRDSIVAGTEHNV